MKQQQQQQQIDTAALTSSFAPPPHGGAHPPLPYHQQYEQIPPSAPSQFTDAPVVIMIVPLAVPFYVEQLFF